MITSSLFGSNVFEDNHPRMHDWFDLKPSKLTGDSLAIQALEQDTFNLDERLIEVALLDKRKRLSNVDRSRNISMNTRMKDDHKDSLNRVKSLYNPKDPNDDLKLTWTPRELIHASEAVSKYRVEKMYKIKDPDSVRRILYLVLLVEKYKPILKELLCDTKYFERYPEDRNDEEIVHISLLDILCRVNEPCLEDQLEISDREYYKNSGLKVVYMQIVKDKVHYYEMVHEILKEALVTSVYELLPDMMPIKLRLENHLTFDIWINKNKMETWLEDKTILNEAGCEEYCSYRNKAISYKEIGGLPYFYELEMIKLSEFLDSSYYLQDIFIPTDRKYCLGMTELVKQLLRLDINKGTIIQTHVQSLSATAYFAFLLGATFTPPLKLKVFGAGKMKESFEKYFELLNLNNVAVISENFYIANPREKSIAKTPCVLVHPETTFDPSLNIIEETVKRGCDIEYMQSKYTFFRENDITNVYFKVRHHHDLKELAKCNVRRALTIPKVKFVVYQSFDHSETPEDNIGLYVVNYQTECSHLSVESVPSDISLSDMSYANYKYLKKLDLYFQQGNTPKHIVSPEIWGSIPPFITTLYRIDPIETEAEINEGTAEGGSVTGKTSVLSVLPVSQKHSVSRGMKSRANILSVCTISSPKLENIKESSHLLKKVITRAEKENEVKGKSPPLSKRSSISKFSQSEESQTKAITRENTKNKSKEKSSSLKSLPSLKSPFLKSLPSLKSSRSLKSSSMKLSTNSSISKVSPSERKQPKIPAQIEPSPEKKSPTKRSAVSIQSTKEQEKITETKNKRKKPADLTFFNKEAILHVQQEPINLRKTILSIMKEKQKLAKKKIDPQITRLPMKKVDDRTEILKRALQKLDNLKQKNKAKRKKMQSYSGVLSAPEHESENKEEERKEKPNQSQKNVLQVNEESRVFQKISDSMKKNMKGQRHTSSLTATKKRNRSNVKKKSTDRKFTFKVKKDEIVVSPFGLIPTANSSKDPPSIESMKIVFEKTRGTQTIQEDRTVDDKGIQVNNVQIFSALMDQTQEDEDVHVSVDLSESLFKTNMETKSNEKDAKMFLAWVRGLTDKNPFRKKESKKKNTYPSSLTYEDIEKDSSLDKAGIEGQFDNLSESESDPKDPVPLLAMMKMFEAGERDLTKLAADDADIPYDETVIDKKPNRITLAGRDDLDFINKMLQNAKDVSCESSESDITDEKDSEGEISDTEIVNRINKVVDSIFEVEGRLTTVLPGGGPKEVPGKTEVITKDDSAPENKKSLFETAKRRKESGDEILTKMVDENIWDKEKQKSTEKGKEKIKPEKEEVGRELSRTLIDMIPNPTSTEGLSRLGKDLYAIRDVVEYYLHDEIEGSISLEMDEQEVNEENEKKE